ncbi:MAG: hypothetical protein CTY34_08245 [Methylobacter sp.]|nr:MAG: hypothetical protein CTY34_08245 [Methylobacter sp.]PPD03057.1 MAG: hypothetical protein CTY29_10885 [Methylobacter sp.]PPD18194.1 MAG: hypothetical protein CTY24_13460 [Methylobacter sp.]PPD36699.1 MAG: hypothetical protein CTY18_02645 [Methylomonas sp.]
MPTFRKIVRLALLSLFLAACSSEMTAPPALVFDVTANAQTNNGGLFYFIVRSSNDKQFVLESYQDVAGKAFSDPPDTNQIGIFSIVPGTKQECTVSPPAQGTIALYFLYTQPGSQWKKLLSTPLANKYNINLTATSQVEIREPKPWYLSWF